VVVPRLKSCGFNLDETQKLAVQAFFILVVDRCMGWCANPRRFLNCHQNHNRGKIINRAMFDSPGRREEKDAGKRVFS
jgi:hypothetical protein